ncbi:amidohydrolase family protein [Spirillospora sp. CA-255316]
MHATSTGSTPVVDVCEVAYDEACWHAYLTNLAGEAPGYLRLFGARLCRLAGLDLPAYRQVVERDPFAAAEELARAGGLTVDFDRHVAALRAQGVVAQVVHGGMWKIPGGNVNDRLAELAAGRPELHFWAGLGLKVPEDAQRELHRAHRELGARGVSLVPFLDDVDVLDPQYAPVFGYAERHRLPVWIHCGNHLAVDRPLDCFSWWHLDRLAARHPELVLIAGHGGWPWLAEMAAVAQRHPHVYLDSSTHRGAAMAKPGYGWEPVLARADTTLRSKLLFGSTTWTTGRTPRELAGEFAALGLRPETVSAWVGGNGARLFGLEPERS